MNDQLYLLEGCSQGLRYHIWHRYVRKTLYLWITSWCPWWSVQFLDFEKSAYFLELWCLPHVYFTDLNCSCWLSRSIFYSCLWSCCIFHRKSQAICFFILKTFSCSANKIYLWIWVCLVGGLMHVGDEVHRCEHMVLSDRRMLMGTSQKYHW